MDMEAIKKRIRELRADPGQSGATEEVQRLRGAYARLKRTDGSRRRVPKEKATPVVDKDDVHAQQLAGIWISDPPPRRGSPYSRVIDGTPREDPGGHGRRNDARRWSPWR